MLKKIGFKIRRNISQWGRQCGNYLSLRDWSIWLLSSLALVFLTEYLQRGSIQETIHFFKETPIATCLNFLIISGSLVAAMSFKRKWFILLLSATIWLLIGVANGVMMKLRGAPFMFSDLFLYKEGLTLIGTYLNVKLIVSLVAAMVGVVALMATLFNKKRKIKILDYILTYVYLVFAIITLYLTHANSWLTPITWDYMLSYQEQGVSYSFLNTIYPYFEGGPDEYSKKTMGRITPHLIADETSRTQDKPNVIYIQLESFMDPTELEGVDYTFDPIPTFRALFEERGGYIQVPTFGGGTVRTEFEILTGMDTDFLKPGEIPNNQLLRTRAVESIASYLKEDGYSTTAIHNYLGSFYNRDTVYGNLGLEQFIPLEFMTRLSTAAYVAGMDDTLITDYIIKSLENTEEQKDFIFAVTTGTHGPYQMYESYRTHPLQVLNVEDEVMRGELQDFAIRCSKLDKQLQRLVDYVEQLEEETIVIMYSDHLPSMGMVNNSDSYSEADKYTVPYAIYSNFELNDVEIPEVIEAYQLSTYVFDLIGMKGGLVNQLHRDFKETEFYEKMKELVQYDLLQGKQYLYADIQAPKQVIPTLGLDEIVAKGSSVEDGKLVVVGENLNPSTQVWVDGKRIKPNFVNTTRLEVDLSQLKKKVIVISDLKKLEIGQVGRYDKVMGALIEVPLWIGN